MINNSNKKISIIIVDDHRMLAEIWAEVLKKDNQYEIIGIFEDTQIALKAIENSRPDIVILDINIEPISGIDATKIIRKDSPSTKIIGMSMYTQPSYAKRMLKNGAKAYVTKNSSKSEMVKAISEVLADRTYVCSEMKNNLAKLVFDNCDEEPKINQLTEREIEILKYLAQGLSSKEIAEKAFISYRTVDVHRSHILKKFDKKNITAVLGQIQNSGFDFI